MKTGWLWWFTRKPHIKDLEALADQVLAAARDGHQINPGVSVHRQLIDERGGTPAWEALKADLALTEQEFQW